MFNVEQLLFLHTLGYAIGHSLWQMALVWVIYTAVINLYRWNSSQRYNMAVCGVIAGFVCFIVTIVCLSFSSSASNEITLVSFSDTGAAEASPANRFLFFYHSLMASLRSLAPYFSCAYLLVMLLLSVKLIRGFNQVNILRTTGLSKAPVEWRLFVRDHAALLGIAQKVRFHISSIATSPLTIGYLKPIILIPLASINNLTAQQLEAVLLHELAHIRRHDYLINIFLQLAEIVLFFNPFMRLLLKQASIERENCCDDCVLQFRYNATEYAKALLAVQQHRMSNILALGLKNNNDFQLLNRVKRMLAPEKKSFNYKQQLGLLFLLTLIGVGFTAITPKTKQQTVVNVEPLQKLTDISVEKNETPVAIDLVKDIEHFVQTTEASANASSTVEAAVELKANELEKQMAPHITKIEQAAKAIDILVGNATNKQNFAATSTDNSYSQTGNVWLRQLPPAFSKGINELEKMTGGLFEVAGIALEAGLSAEMKKLQHKIEFEQTKLAEIAKEKRNTADSLSHVYRNAQNMLGQHNQENEHAAKAFAIAPFRVWKHTSTNNNQENFTFDFSNDDDNTNLEFAVAEPTGRPAAPPTFFSGRNNFNSTSEKPAPVATTITVINGKQLAARVKKVWAEAQLELKNSWTPAMQQKILNEIKQELQSLENIDIKTKVNIIGSNNKSFVIEVETTE